MKARPIKGKSKKEFKDSSKKTLEELKIIRAELAVKNHELKIEAALERVRGIAMAMRKPDDMLKICKTISLQLQKLGVKEIRNVQTAIFYEEHGTYMNYEYYAKHNKTFITETSYTNHKIHKAFAEKMLKGKGEFFITHIKGKKVKDWIAYQKTTNVFIDKYLNKASSLNYYWHSLGPVALGISTYVPLHEDDLKLFKRFLNVFELAYTRYLDIEQALSQAKEAKIEAALEKVRAQALGMHKPDDLLNVCKVLFKELLGLGFTQLRNAIIHSFKDEKEYFTDYDYSDLTGGAITDISYNSNPIIKKFIKQIRRSDNAFVEITIAGDELKDWRKFRKKGGQPDDPRLNRTSAINYYIYAVGSASIGVSTFDAIKEEKLQLLKRFRNVFDFAYRRYTDVAQAEAQAREAKIEAALEKVRAQAMSMRKSEELIGVCEAMYKELTALGFDDIRNAQISIKNPADSSYFVTEYSDHVSVAVNEAPLDSSPLIKNIYEEMERSDDAFYQREYSGKDFENWRAWRMNIDAAKDPRIMKATSMWFYLYSIGSGYLGISTFHAIANEKIEVLKRFRNVFELSYRRYMDVAQAEAQAREAKIELALERVRARTMAMQKSDELREAVLVIYEQICMSSLSL